MFDGFLFYLQENEETFSRWQIEEARTCLAIDALPTWPMITPDAGEARDQIQIMIDEYAAAAE